MPIHPSYFCYLLEFSNAAFASRLNKEILPPNTSSPRQFGYKMATALPVRTQRSYNANSCGIAASGLTSVVLQRQSSITPMPR
jgi:hypothetical protein